MIILRNKIYASSNNIKSELDKRSTPKEMVGLDIQSSAGPYRSPLGDTGSSISIGGATQGFRQIGRVGNTLEKTMSDVNTPMGVNYVSNVQVTPKPQPPKKKAPWLSRVLRKNVNSITSDANSALDNLPMSAESKNKQRRKLNALKFWVNKGTRGIDKAAEKLCSDLDRMPVSSADMRKAETDGVVQRRPDGKWGIIAKKKRLWWSAGYDSRESAEAALRAYHAGRH